PLEATAEGSVMISRTLPLESLVPSSLSRILALEGLRVGRVAALEALGVELATRDKDPSRACHAKPLPINDFTHLALGPKLGYGPYRRSTNNPATLSSTPPASGARGRPNAADWKSSEGRSQIETSETYVPNDTY